MTQKQITNPGTLIELRYSDMLVECGRTVAHHIHLLAVGCAGNSPELLPHDLTALLNASINMMGSTARRLFPDCNPYAPQYILEETIKAIRARRPGEYDTVPESWIEQLEASV